MPKPGDFEHLLHIWGFSTLRHHYPWESRCLSHVCGMGPTDSHGKNNISESSLKVELFFGERNAVLPSGNQTWLENPRFLNGGFYIAVRTSSLISMVHGFQPAMFDMFDETRGYPKTTWRGTCRARTLWKCQVGNWNSGDLALAMEELWMWCFQDVSWKSLTHLEMCVANVR